MQANTTTPRKGAMLLRKSRADEEKEKLGEFETLANHEAELRALADKMQLPIDDVYKELVSGNDFKHRDSFKELMDRVGKNEYAYVLVHAVDRLSRGDLMENGWILSNFQYSGTLIVTPTKVFNPIDIMDLQQLQFMLLYSNIEYSIIQGRMQSGKEASVRNGEWIASKTLYGYDKHTRKDGRKTLVVNEKSSAVVTEIFERIAGGECRAAVAKDLNRRGIPSPSGRTWSPMSIIHCVTNISYLGKVTWGKSRVKVNGRDGIAVKKTVIQQDEYIIADGLHDAIVSEELWACANVAISTKSSKTRHEFALKNPLAGVLVCKKCGVTMTRRCKKEREYIAHPQYTKCGCRSAKLKRVVEAVADALSELAEDYMVVAENGDTCVAEHDRRVSVLEAEIASAERQKDKLVELYTADAIDISEFRDRRAPIEERIEKLSSALEEERSFTPEPASAVADKLRNVVRMITDDTLSAQVRNDALKMVVESITYDNDEGHIHLGITLR